MTVTNRTIILYWKKENKIYVNGIGATLFTNGDFSISNYKEGYDINKKIEFDATNNQISTINYSKDNADGFIRIFDTITQKETIKYIENSAEITEELYLLKQKYPFDIDKRYNNWVDKEDFIIKEVVCLQSLDFYNQIFSCSVLKKQISAENYSKMEKAWALVSTTHIISQFEIRDDQFGLVLNDAEEKGFSYVSIGQLYSDEDNCKIVNGLSMYVNTDGNFYLGYRKDYQRHGDAIFYDNETEEVEVGPWADRKEHGKFEIIDIHTGAKRVANFEYGIEINEKLYELKKQHPFDIEQRYKDSPDKKEFIINEVANLKPLDFYNGFLSCTDLKKQISVDFYSKWQKALNLVNVSEISSEITTEDKEFGIIFYDYHDDDISSLYVGQISTDQDNIKTIDGFGIFVVTDGNLSIGYQKENEREGKIISYVSESDEVSISNWKKNIQEGDFSVFNVATGEGESRYYENGVQIK